MHGASGGGWAGGLMLVQVCMLGVLLAIFFLGELTVTTHPRSALHQKRTPVWGKSGKLGLKSREFQELKLRVS